MNALNVAVDLDYSWWYDAEEQLLELREEVAESRALDTEIEPVPDTAYTGARCLLHILFKGNLPVPDIGWVIDGGIGFEWRSSDGKGIATMSIYGEHQIVYGVSSESVDRISGECALSDFVPLGRFFSILIRFCAD